MRLIPVSVNILVTWQELSFGGYIQTRDRDSHRHDWTQTLLFSLPEMLARAYQGKKRLASRVGLKFLFMITRLGTEIRRFFRYAARWTFCALGGSLLRASSQQYEAEISIDAWRFIAKGIG